VASAHVASASATEEEVAAAGSGSLADDETPTLAEPDSVEPTADDALAEAGAGGRAEDEPAEETAASTVPVAAAVDQTAASAEETTGATTDEVAVVAAAESGSQAEDVAESAHATDSAASTEGAGVESADVTSSAASTEGAAAEDTAAASAPAAFAGTAEPAESAAYRVGSYGAGSVDPLADGSQPVGHPIKGNADSMLYHAPESPWYDRTKAEVWFADEATAAAAGFARWDSRSRGRSGRPAGDEAPVVPVYAVGAFGEGSVDPLADGSMPVGFDVKGNADSMLYHSPASPWYGRTKAEVWFRDEETAQAAGFKHWDPAKR